MSGGMAASLGVSVGAGRRDSWLVGLDVDNPGNLDSLKITLQDIMVHFVMG